MGLRANSFLKCPTTRLLLALWTVVILAVTFLLTQYRLSPPVEWTLREAPSTPAPCHRQLRFSRVQLPVTALASAQGSGNTWMRNLLQQLTGLYTGSVYDASGDPELVSRGYLGEGVTNGSVIAIKTHQAPTSIFQRVILVIRNPFHAILADFNRRASGSHVGLAPAHAYIRYWKNFTQVYINRWKDFYAAWAKFKGPVLLVVFEDLVRSLDTEIREIAKFLNHPTIHMDTHCAIENSVDRAKREDKGVFDSAQLFSAEDVRSINKHIVQVQRILQDRFPRVQRGMRTWLRPENVSAVRWKAMPSGLN